MMKYHPNHFMSYTLRRLVFDIRNNPNLLNRFHSERIVVFSFQDIKYGYCFLVEAGMVYDSYHLIHYYNGYILLRQHELLGLPFTASYHFSYEEESHFLPKENEIMSYYHFPSHAEISKHSWINNEGIVPLELRA